MLLGRHTSFFPDHQQNSPTFPDQINSVNFQVSENRDYVEDVPSQNVWQLFTSAMVSSRQNSNSSSAWNVMSSSDHRHGQDKTVYVKTSQFCPVSKCGVNWILSCLDLVSNLQLFSLKYMYTCHRVCIICCQTNATRQWQADCVMRTTDY